MCLLSFGDRTFSASKRGNFECMGFPIPKPKTTTPTCLQTQTEIRTQTSRWPPSSYGMLCAVSPRTYIAPSPMAPTKICKKTYVFTTNNARCRFHPPVRRGEPMRAVCDDVRKRDSCVYGMTLSPSLGSGPLCAAALGVAWRGCAFGGF